MAKNLTGFIRDNNVSYLVLDYSLQPQFIETGKLNSTDFYKVEEIDNRYAVVGVKK